MRTQTRSQFPAILLAIFLIFFVTNCVVDKDENKPVVATVDVTEVRQRDALCSSLVISDGGYEITARGVCWSTSPDPTIADNITTDGAGGGRFTSTLTDLAFKTTYYVRAYATNSMGTGYGAVVSFTTFDKIIFNPDISYGTLTDIEGNTYKTVIIGTQTWMAENLRVSKYNDGTNIPLVTNSTVWSELTTGAFCNYNNTTNNDTIETYGRLYNWFAVDSGKLCPVGWHVPTEAEWTTLIDFLGGGSLAGGKLKEAYTIHWHSPNIGATNESGFTGLPAGAREEEGLFSYLGILGAWWSTTDNHYGDAYIVGVINEYNEAGCDGSNASYDFGLSVRCLKD